MARTAVLISHYNDSDSLLKCVSSILSSSDPDFQVNIYDDNSDPAHLNGIDDILSLDKRIKATFGSDNRGCGYGFNLLSNAADSKIIHYVGADDLIHPRRIADSVEFHDTYRYNGNPCQLIPILSTNIKHLDNRYQLLPSVPAQPLTDSLIKASMYFYTPIVHGTISIPRIGYDRLSPFDDQRRAGVDYMFFCKNNSLVHYFNKGLSRYYIRLKEGSLTRSVSTRQLQLQTHDEAMFHLWKQLLNYISIEEIRTIRRILISSDDVSNNYNPTRSALNQAIRNIGLLIDRLEGASISNVVAIRFLNVLNDYASKSG